MTQHMCRSCCAVELTDRTRSTVWPDMCIACGGGGAPDMEARQALVEERIKAQRVAEKKEGGRG